MRTFEAQLLAAVGAALIAVGPEVLAQPQPAAGTGLEVRLSGHLNRALLIADDGRDRDLFHVDNDNSSTRLRLAGTATMSPGLRAGVVFEVEYQSNASNLVNFASRETTPTLDERHIDTFFEGGWGRLALGQADGAANGGVEVDLSGTAVAHWADVPAIGGGFAFRSDGTFGPTVSAVISHQDFESRYDRLRYDTPVFAGFRLAGSYGVRENRDVRELALWYAGNLGALGQLAGALGVSNQDNAPGGVNDEVMGGSISWLHGSGFNLTVGRTERDITADREGKFTYFKVGYKFGRHAVSLDHARGDDQAASGDEAQSTGLAYVFAPVAWADLYAMYKRMSLDRNVGSFDDLDFLMLGTRLKF